MKKNLKYQVMEFLEELSVGKKVTKRNPIKLPSSIINDRFGILSVSAKKELRNLRGLKLISYPTPVNHSRDTIYSIIMINKSYPELIKLRKTVKDEVSEIMNACDNRNLPKISGFKKG